MRRVFRCVQIDTGPRRSPSARSEIYFFIKKAHFTFARRCLSRLCTCRPPRHVFVVAAPVVNNNYYISKHAGSERRGPVSISGVPKGAPRPGLSDATLRSAPAPRGWPSAWGRKVVKNRLRGVVAPATTLWPLARPRPGIRLPGMPSHARGSTSALHRQRRRHVHGAGVDAPVLKMSASVRAFRRCATLAQTYYCTRVCTPFWYPKKRPSSLRRWVIRPRPGSTWLTCPHTHVALHQLYIGIVDGMSIAWV